MSDAYPSILWLRDDLRLADHPALSAAVEEGSLLCVYLFDEASEGLRPLGGAARWWLRHSLESLSTELEKRSGRLDVLSGAAEEVIPAIATAARSRVVFWTQRYGAAERATDLRVASILAAKGVAVRVFAGCLLHDPQRLKTRAGEPFRVYTPFLKALRASVPEPGPIWRAPRLIGHAPWPRSAPKRVSLDALKLLPTRPDWAGGLREVWRPGEPEGRNRLAGFVETKLASYAWKRDAPGLDAVSRLSPHLRFGEISPRQVWRAAAYAAETNQINDANLDKFFSELAWRDFSYHLLFHAPELPTRNLNRAFDKFPWRKPHATETRAWQNGQTGFPIVDAGMRQLWRTGYMHNRVRLIAASFLVKDLLIDWRVGEAWFWDTLCDADPANNAANWQWSAGSGADAAPYFRVLNPVLQSSKFDSDGAYIREYAPELRALPNAWIHEPWSAPPAILSRAGVTLGKTYPRPIVDHQEARSRALAALRATKAAT